MLRATASCSTPNMAVASAAPLVQGSPRCRRTTRRDRSPSVDRAARRLLPLVLAPGWPRCGRRRPRRPDGPCRPRARQRLQCVAVGVRVHAGSTWRR
jgi:hypothetical protein